MTMLTTDETSDPDVGQVAGIPVRNIWLLMLYASDLYRTRGRGRVDVEDNPDDIADLVAIMLCRRVEYRIQRNLSFGYQNRHAVLNRVRGRINLLRTERHRLLERGRVACHFEELTIDTKRNRYVRIALEKVSKIVRDDNLAHRCRMLAVRLGRMGVSGEHPSRQDLSFERFGVHDRDDQPMVAAASLALDLALPTEIAGKHLLSCPDREINWIRKLYEQAVAGFYEVVLSDKGWRVRPGKTLSWQIEDKSAGIDEILPRMRTDIVLENEQENRRIVIDTKFNAILTTGWYRPETLRSAYIYQIYAYLKSQVDSSDPCSVDAAGLLLHPSVGVMVDEFVVIQNHKIHFATVDLAADASEIRRQLLKVVDAQA